MKWIAAYCILLISSLMLHPAFLHAQRATPEPVREATPFKLDILSFANESALSSDSIRADLYFAVPYPALEFLRLRENYSADYSLSLTVTDSATSVMAVNRFENYRVVEPMAEHASRVESGVSRADAEQLSMPLRAGTAYKVHLTFRDQNSRKEIDTTLPFTTKDFRSVQATLSDMMLYRSRRANRIVPSIGSDVAELAVLGAGVFAEAYNLPADSLLGVVAEVLPLAASSGNAEPLVRSTGTMRTSSHRTMRVPIFQNISFADLWTGHYRLRMYLLSNVADTGLSTPGQLTIRAIATSEREITVSSSHGIPLASGDLDEAIEQLRLIATGSEWDSLSAGQNPREKREAIVDFWQKRIPSHDERTRWTESENRPMKVFYARIAYVNAHFGAGSHSGWKSDRGRVYVALGPPHAVDRHPYESNQKPYEVWQYYSPMNVQYYFVDAYLLGDYRLRGLPPPQGTFVWQ